MPHVVKAIHWKIWGILGIATLVGGFNPTHLKNMRKSNWIISPGRDEHTKIVELPPSRTCENSPPFLRSGTPEPATIRSGGSVCAQASLDLLNKNEWKKFLKHIVPLSK